MTLGTSWLALPLPESEKGPETLYTIERSGEHTVSKGYSFTSYGLLSSSRREIENNTTWRVRESGKETRTKYRMNQSLSVTRE